MIFDFSKYSRPCAHDDDVHDDDDGYDDDDDGYDDDDDDDDDDDNGRKTKDIISQAYGSS